MEEVVSISEIEDRIRDRVERLWDMAPASLDTPEAWSRWKRRCVSEVAIIVADELARERRMNDAAERFERAIR